MHINKSVCSSPLYGYPAPDRERRATERRERSEQSEGATPNIGDAFAGVGMVAVAVSTGICAALTLFVAAWMLHFSHTQLRKKSATNIKNL